MIFHYVTVMMAENVHIDKKSLDQNLRGVYKFANVATWSKKVPRGIYSR
jgi:hypothetical protein